MDKGISIPKTLLIKDVTIDEVLKLIEENFDEKVVLKGERSGGENVYFSHVDDKQKIQLILEKHFIKDTKPDNLIIQQYLKILDEEGFPYHYRALVVDRELVTLMKFTSQDKKNFASNIALGAEAKIVDKSILSSHHRDEIVRACRLMSSNVSGVDVVLLDGELYILR